MTHTHTYSHMNKHQTDKRNPILIMNNWILWSKKKTFSEYEIRRDTERTSVYENIKINTLQMKVRLQMTSLACCID